MTTPTQGAQKSHVLFPPQAAHGFGPSHIYTCRFIYTLQIDLFMLFYN